VLYLKNSCICHLTDNESLFLLSGFDLSQPINLDQPIADYFYGDLKEYRAPEELRASDKQDIWAFGCILMEVASSGSHMAFKSFMDAIQYSEGGMGLPHLRDRHNPRLDEGFRSILNSILKSCFELDPAKRPSAEELRWKLIALAGVYQGLEGVE
jgi:Protein kinase domain